MDKRLIKYLWALPLLGVLSSCSESSLDEGSQNANYAVQFNVSTSKQSNSGSTKSRAFIVDNDEVNNKDFGLFAYSHSGTWADFLAGGIGTPNFMNDQLVSHNTGSWVYSPLKFWTNDNISFFGYWPKEAGVTTASVANNAMPQVEFTQKMDAENMVDFITSNNAINQNRDADGVVTLDFKHVLTRLNFQARLDEALEVDPISRIYTTHVFLKSLKICGTDGSYDPKAPDGQGGTGAKVANGDSKFYKTATFVLGDGSVTTGAEANGKWDYTAATAQDAELDLASILKTENNKTWLTSTSDPTQKYTATAIDLNNDGSPTDLLKQTADATPKQHYVFLIPPHGKDGIQSEKDVIMELEYDIVTLDESLLGNNKLIIIPKHYAVSLPNTTLQQGVSYNIIFTVGMNPVKVDVNVSDWDNNVTKYASSTKANSNSVDDILAAWDEMNKAKKQGKTGNYFVINVDQMPTSTLNLRTTSTGASTATRFDAFEMGDQVELKFADEDQATAVFAQTVLVPNGWVYKGDHTVNGEKRHIITKTSTYITEVAAATTQSAMQTAFSSLNTQKASNPNVHNYAVDVYTAAPASAGDVDLSTVVTSTVDNLSNFTTEDNLYLVFNSENSSGTPLNITAPTGWTITATKTPGKYLLKKAGSTNGASASISIGDQGFNIAADGTINVN